MLDKINELEQNNEISDISLLNYEVELSVADWKLNVDNILSYDNIFVVKKLFFSLWFRNYYDFYFLESKEFKEILRQNKNLYTFFKKVVWKENFKSSYISSKHILMFAERIWFEKNRLIEVREQILLYISENSINTLNDFNKYWLNKFKILCKNNSYLRFMIHSKIWKSYINIDLNDYSRLWKLLWLELIKLEVVVEEKKNIIVDKNEYVINFLRNNSINDFEDLIWCWIKWVRELLWSDPICREVLKSLWVIALKDFREKYIKRFSRKVWLKWVPKENNKNLDELEIETIQKFKNLLWNIWIDCTYGLKLKWIKYLLNNLKEKLIWKIIFSEIRDFIKKYFWERTISLLLEEDLILLGKLLGLDELDDKQHKEKLNIYLKSHWINIEKLNKTNIKTKYWKNTHIRYFLDKQWLSDVKVIRPEHIIEMKKYLESIN